MPTAQSGTLGPAGTQAPELTAPGIRRSKPLVHLDVDAKANLTLSCSMRRTWRDGRSCPSLHTGQQREPTGDLHELPECSQQTSGIDFIFPVLSCEN